MTYNEDGRLSKFRGSLLANGLSPDTASDYCSYIARIESDFGKSADEIVATDEAMVKCLDSFQEKLQVSESSFSSYACGLRAYYRHVNNRTFEICAKGEVNEPKKIKAELHWYQEFVVKDLDQWWHFVCRLNAMKGNFDFDPRCWAYRGQGNASWGLDSSLGRIVKYGETDGNAAEDRLLLYERESMWTFARESAKSADYRGFDGCDLLSLMQHYECKTRFLDFTMAPLVALYMAVEQHETDYAKAKAYVENNIRPSQRNKLLRRPDLACWAVNLNALIEKIGSCNTKRDVCQNTVEDAFEIASGILNSHEKEDRRGVLPIFPKMCNQRIAAQDGLFLMPKSLRYGFEDNLRAAIGEQTYPSDDLTSSSCHGSAVVYKFVFSSKLIGKIKRFLRDANVTAKTLYPDLIGLGRFVSQEIQRHEDDAL